MNANNLTFGYKRVLLSHPLSPFETSPSRNSGRGVSDSGRRKKAGKWRHNIWKRQKFSCNVYISLGHAEDKGANFLHLPRLPYDKGEYVQCCKYHACYHTGCVKVPEYAVNTNCKRKWGCQKCKDDIALKTKNILVFRAISHGLTLPLIKCKDDIALKTKNILASIIQQ